MTEKPVALVTGASGFCGHHLVLHLSRSGYEVAGFDRAAQPGMAVTIHTGDVTDASSVATVLASLRPTVIFHLAALTNPQLDYDQLHQVNGLGTFTLLRAVREVCPNATVLVSSSSAVYGHVPPAAIPIGENQPFQPASLYAVSKISQEMIAYQQYVAHGVRVIRTRAFNLTGPGESINFVTSAFARQISEIEAGLREPVLRVGNLNTVRDFTDVRDAVRAYRLLAEQGKIGKVYNVCSERGIRIRDLLDILLDLSTVHPIEVQRDPTRLQPADVPVQIGEAIRIRGTTGWAPAIPIHQTLQDVLDHWRQRIANRSAA